MFLSLTNLVPYSRQGLSLFFDMKLRALLDVLAILSSASRSFLAEYAGQLHNCRHNPHRRVVAVAKAVGKPFVQFMSVPDTWQRQTLIIYFNFFPTSKK